MNGHRLGEEDARFYRDIAASVIEGDWRIDAEAIISPVDAGNTQKAASYLDSLKEEGGKLLSMLHRLKLDVPTDTETPEEPERTETGTSVILCCC